MSTLHTCPKDGCSAQLPFKTLACKRHWFSLPPELRQRIGRLWRDGDLPGYIEARHEALAVLNGTVR